MATLKLTGAIGLFCAVVASACADSSPSIPTSPSAASPSGPTGQTALESPVVVSATMNDAELNAAFGHGHGNGNGGNPNANGGGNQNGHGDDADHNDGPPAIQAPVPPAAKTVEIEGLISAIAGGVVTVNGQAVVVPPTVIVHHGSHLFDFSDLDIGDRVHIRASLILAVLTASEVKLQNAGGRDDGEDDDVFGGSDQLLIEGLIKLNDDPGACPSRTLTMGSTLVHTSTATVYVNVTCATLAGITDVKITGVIQPDTSFLALKIERVP